MASDRDQWADNLSGESSGWLPGFLAEEDEFDRRALWRLGSWGVGAVAAVIVALVANQSSMGWRRDQLASADLVRQSQQIQWIAKESQNETRRLASAIETLNSDRDRLYSRVTVLEQGLDSVTGSIGRQSAAASPAPSTSGSAVSTSSAPQPAADPPTASLIGPPTPTAAPSASLIGPPAPAPSPTVSQNSASPIAAAPTKTAGAATDATADKASAVAALAPDPPAANVPAQPQPAAPARPEITNNASSAAITAPVATATAAQTTATAAQATATAAQATATAAPTTPLMPIKSLMAPPDPAATKLTEPEPAANNTSTLPALPPPQTIAAAPAMTEPDTAETPAPPAIAVQHTEFGIDLGSANSVDGLRALWRGLLKYRSNKALAELRPIIVVKERSNGLGMQLRLVAGPISDAAAAAKICATLTESDRSCETSVFDGQRLAVTDDHSPSPSVAPPRAVSNSRAAAPPARPSRKRAGPKGAKIEEPAAKPEPPKSSLTSFLGMH